MNVGGVHLQTARKAGQEMISLQTRPPPRSDYKQKRPIAMHHASCKASCPCVRVALRWALLLNLPGLWEIFQSDTYNKHDA